MPEKVAPLPDPDVWGFLQYIDPIDDPDMLAFQVAQLTVGMAELKRRLDEATWVDREFVRQLMKDIANERSE